MIQSYIDQEIERIEKAARNEHSNVLEQTNLLLERFPQSPRVWALRSYVLGREGRFELACADLTEAIQLSSAEVSLFFDRGRYFMELGRYENARKDFSRGIELCEELGDSYYEETLRFFRAELSYKMGDRKLAKDDIQKVRDEVGFWLDGAFRTKGDILRDCAEEAK
jgi:tetratricopeptide (TPR) repeat protein